MQNVAAEALYIGRTTVRAKVKIKAAQNAGGPAPILKKNYAMVVAVKAI